MPKLSILIYTHVTGWPLYERMAAHLKEGFFSSNDIEILVIKNNDNGNRKNVGDRDELIDRAAGDYCCFVDDDDVVSDDYVWKILQAISAEPDICSISGLVTSLVNNEQHAFELSTKYERLFSLPSNEIEDDTYKRFASHLNPIRTAIAREVRFPEDVFHEDNGYS